MTGRTTTYAALLRGINVGGSRKLPMAELRALMGELGYGGVRTYLQSGQAVFTAERGDEESLAAELAGAIRERFGFGVDVLVRDHAYLRGVREACPFPAERLEGKQLHATFFSVPVEEARFASVGRDGFLPEDYRLGDRVLYLYAPEGLGRSKLAVALSSRRVVGDAVATTRNWNTVRKLEAMTSA
jgi:uncharacterized protein (DUF1697 family)